MPCCAVPAELFTERHGAYRKGRRGGTADEGAARQHGKSFLAGVMGGRGLESGTGRQGLGKSSLAGVFERQRCAGCAK